MRRSLLLLAVIAVAFGRTADARRDRTVTGDVIKAARFLTTSRLDEARTLLDDLKKRAADALAKARDRARSAARQAQESAGNDEPIRIPGSDEYKAPERFREEILEGAKKKPPDAYKDMSDQYYKDITK